MMMTTRLTSSQKLTISRQSIISQWETAMMEPNFNGKDETFPALTKVPTDVNINTLLINNCFVIV